MKVGKDLRGDGGEPGQGSGAARVGGSAKLWAGSGVSRGVPDFEGVCAHWGQGIWTQQRLAVLPFPAAG